MNLKIKTTPLKTCIHQISQITPSFSNIPDYMGIFVSVYNSRIVLQAKNEYINMRTELRNIDDFTITDTGVFFIKGKMLADILSKINDDELTLSMLEDNLLLLKSKSSEYKITLLDPEDFDPQEQDFEITPTDVLSINSLEFKQILSSVSLFIPANPPRKILRGMNIKKDENAINFITTDVTRISKAAIEFNEAFNNDYTISLKSIKEVVKQLTTNEEIDLKFTKNRVLIQAQDYILSTTLLEGIFPNISKAFKFDFEKEIKLKKNTLNQLLEQIYVLTAQNPMASPIIKIVIEEGVLNIESKDLELGYVHVQTSNFQANFDSLFAISINPKYITEALKMYEDDEITLKLIDSDSLIQIQGKSSIDVINLILPYSSN